MKIQRLFSNVEEERLYSTGNDELDELLERAFCEGYEYAQREFGNKENKAKKRAWIRNSGIKSGEYESAARQYGPNSYQAEQAAIRKGKSRLGLESPEKPVRTGTLIKNNKVTGVYEEFGDLYPGVGNVNKNKTGQNILKGKSKTEREIVKTNAKLRHTKDYDERKNLEKTLKKLETTNKLKKAALIGVPVAAAVVGTGIAIDKSKKDKKKKKEQNK